MTALLSFAFGLTLGLYLATVRRLPQAPRSPSVNEEVVAMEKEQEIEARIPRSSPRLTRQERAYLEPEARAVAQWLANKESPPPPRHFGS